jgi:hypothetical protein
MPGIIPFIPAILGIGAMVSQNVQNKAAIKNNEQQQAAAMGNANAAWNNARNQTNQWIDQNPTNISGAGKAPSIGAQPTVTGGLTPGSSPMNLGSLMANLTPQQKMMLQQIMGQQVGGTSQQIGPRP